MSDIDRVELSKHRFWKTVKPEMREATISRISHIPNWESLSPKNAAMAFDWDKTCAVCSSTAAFGKEFCSKNCANSFKANDPTIRQKMKETILLNNNGRWHDTNREKTSKTVMERYGVDCVLKLDSIKEKIKETIGCQNVSQLDYVKEKKKRSSLEKYGTTSYLNSKQGRESLASAMIQQHGVTHFWASDESRNKAYSILESKRNAKRIAVVSNDYSKLSDSAVALLEETSKSFSSKYRRAAGINPSTINALEVKTSSLFIPHDVEFEYHKTGLLSNKRREIDIYIPSKKLGIDIGGSYWHSDKKDYHIQKFIEAEEAGISLLQLFDFDLFDSRKIEVLRSMINSRLGRYDRILNGRNCEVRVIDTPTARSFCDSNHFQGFTGATHHYGLFHNEELVSYMSFGGNRFAKNVNTSKELIRFCNKKNTKIHGSAAKLFAQYMNDHNPKSIISFSDNRLFSGKTYLNLGFAKEVVKNPSYVYVKGNKILSRFECQRHKLENTLTKFDKDLTESENMLMNGWLKVYDAGQTKWIKE